MRAHGGLVTDRNSAVQGACSRKVDRTLSVGGLGRVRRRLQMHRTVRSVTVRQHATLRARADLNASAAAAEPHGRNKQRSSAEHFPESKHALTGRAAICESVAARAGHAKAIAVAEHTPNAAIVIHNGLRRRVEGAHRARRERRHARGGSLLLDPLSQAAGDGHSSPLRPARALSEPRSQAHLDLRQRRKWPLDE